MKMKYSNHSRQMIIFIFCWVLGLLAVYVPDAKAQSDDAIAKPVSISPSSSSSKPTLPAALEDWVDWVQWGDAKAPKVFDQLDRRLPYWPSQLDLDITDTGGEFSIAIRAYDEARFSLPGSAENWPLDVSIDRMPVPVIHKGQTPSIALPEGDVIVRGTFRWQEMPQTLSIPSEVGILRLSVNGEAVADPNWDSRGKLWLKRTGETAKKNLCDIKIYRNLMDGSPMWLMTDVELTVSGKSREEDLGAILPEGWSIASLSAPIPCALDDDGLLKAQVRAGKWVVSVAAFSTSPQASFRYAEGMSPAVEQELVSLQNSANFRVIEFVGVPSIDAAQTTFPDKWRKFPLHEWRNATPFQINEKMRGMGQKKAAGINIKRQFWLDEDGRELTYRDTITGNGLQIWRLDAAEGQRLGGSKIGSESQLITHNPETGAVGVEIRTRNLSLDSVGRMDRRADLPATGWRKDAENLSGTLYLPPGWRALAIWGADYSQGDWVSAWSLLDVFLVVVFVVAVFRCCGWQMGVIAIFASLLNYQESGSPRAVLVLLLIAFILCRVVPAGKVKRVLYLSTYAALLLAVVVFLPYARQQLQQAIYPQFETHQSMGTRNWVSNSSSAPRGPIQAIQSRKKKVYEKSNLKQRSEAKIQTGPAVPEWSWRSVSFNWSGPVTESETMTFALVPSWLQRILTVVKILLLVVLFYGFVRLLRREKSLESEMLHPLFAQSAAAKLLIATLLVGSVLAGAASSLHATTPDPQLLKALRERLNDEPEGIAQYAEIPSVDLSIDGQEITIDSEIHTAALTAVPLPGRLPTWSPVSVSKDNGKSLPTIRHEGFLWVVLEPGTHDVSVKGRIPTGDWEWSFRLKPRYVSIDAPGWTITGVKPNGMPEDQVFFVENDRRADSEVEYDRKDFDPIVEISRSLELGLNWESRTTVVRLSPLGKAVSMTVPLMPGERVLTPGFSVEDGQVEVRLSAQQKELVWESQLSQSDQIELVAGDDPSWVERWSVLASPNWNLSIQGLAPLFEPQASAIMPFWKPWPGESATLLLSRPEAIDGDTLTIRQAVHRMNLGMRQRSSSLRLSVQTSLGEEVAIGLGEEAAITSFRLNGKESNVRQEGANVLVSLSPGEQVIDLQWTTPEGYATVARADRVELPAEAANVSTVMKLSTARRWVLWADGPQRGPVVRTWALLIIVLACGFALGKVSWSPLRSYQWMLLLAGLTQIPVIAAFCIVAYLFWVSLKGFEFMERVPNPLYNLNQLITIMGVLPFAIILIWALNQGLMGSPDMRVSGEGSYRETFQWFQARSETNILPDTSIVSVSIWYYRAMMLLWAAWLAVSVVSWSKWGWKQLLLGGFWRTAGNGNQPPPLQPRQSDVAEKKDHNNK